MANYDNLKNAISDVIKKNGNNEITGDVLQNALLSIISTIGKNATFAGIATPETNPGTPDQNIFYIAFENGVYVNFSAYEVTKNAVIFSNKNGSWIATELDTLSSYFSNATLYDMAYSGHVPVDLNHLYSFDAGNGYYIESSNWDAAIIRIYKDDGYLSVVGAKVAYFLFFDEPFIKDTYLEKNTSGKIPSGAKLCVLDFKKSDNPNGYNSLRIRQNGGGADKKDLDDLKSKVYSINNRIAKISYASVADTSETVGSFISDSGSPINNKKYHYFRFDVNEDNIYFITTSITGGELTFVFYYGDGDSYLGKQFLSSEYSNNLTREQITMPEGTRYILVNASKSVIPVLEILNNDNFYDIGAIDRAVTKFDYEIVQQTSDINGMLILSSGKPSSNANFHYVRFEIDNDSDTYLVSSGFGSNTDISLVYYYDINDNCLGRQYYKSTGASESYQEIDAPLTMPNGTAYILVNASNSYSPSLKIERNEGYLDLNKLERDVEQIISSNGGLMRVHIYDVEPNNGANAFFVRTKFNSEKDILILYYVNNNTLLSPHSAYVGLSSLNDADLMASTNRVSSHDDSTAPLFMSSIYWHLFAQHGYVIPVIPNNVNMTTADIGALWKDQLNREYNIGNIVGSNIYLLPVITRGAEGEDTRGWKTPNDTKILTLTHVNGGSVTKTINVSSQSTVQLRPIMKHEKRKFFVNGSIITEPGDYYCNDFSVSESQIGYDPATITTWFPTPGIIGFPDLTGALEMARFTWSYNFKGAQCCVNTTIDIRRKVECQSYGATQQQTFVDKGNYKAMFIIPKAAQASDGTILDKPFNSPSLSSPGYVFYRNTTYLKDVDKPIDRLIAMLHNPTDDSYLVGMAAGLSLVSGETIPERRNANIPIATTTDGHERLGSFSPSNNNKFYIAAVNTAPFKSDGYNFPNTYFKEINYYVSYFDPAENEGQLYWYKDGNSFVIYSHCQSVQNRLALRLPFIMEGLSVEVVEKTDNVTLLTETIQNGKLFVNYDTDDANYIVLKTK